MIFNQAKDFSNYDEADVKAQIAEVKRQKEMRQQNELTKILELVSDNMRRVIELAQQNGSGA